MIFNTGVLNARGATTRREAQPGTLACGSRLSINSAGFVIYHTVIGLGATALKKKIKGLEEVNWTVLFSSNLCIVEYSAASILMRCVICSPAGV